jgi:uroporphyrinogen-III synthase
MSLANRKILAPAQGTASAKRKLNISVVFTSVESTLAALKEAGTLASSLGARITLLVPQVVRYPLQLENPPVSVDFSRERLREIASQSPVETRVHLYLCRDKIQTLIAALKPKSIVVLGGRKGRWWPTRDEALARALRRAGHEVIFRQTE